MTWLALLVGLILAAAIHIVTVLLVPRMAPQSDYERFVMVGAEFRFVILLQLIPVAYQLFVC